MSNDTCETPLLWTSLMISINILSSIIGALGNILVCLAVWRTQSLHSAVNYHLVSLAIADLIVTVIVQPLMVAVLAGRISGSLGCHSTLDTVYRAIGNFSCAASFLNLCLITLERILAVLRPFSTYKRARSKGFLMALLAAWLIPLAYAVLRVLSSRKATSYFSGAIFALGYIWMVSCYAVILISLHAQAKRQETLTLTDRRQRKNERKITLTMILVIVCFTVMWLPFFYFRLSGNTSLNMGVLYEIAITMALCNSLFNPIIYSFRNKKYRNAFKSILHYNRSSNLTTRSTKHSTVSKIGSTGNQVWQSSALTMSSLQATPPPERKLLTTSQSLIGTNL